MSNKKKSLFLFYLLLFLFIIFLIFISIKYSGFSIFTSSRVSIDEGIRVICDKFSGSTTGFLFLSDLQLANISNMTLEIPNYGKIFYLDRINLTMDAHNYIVDIDSNVNISDKIIDINGSGLVSVSNKLSYLYFYNIDYFNPRILSNGAICTDTCQLVSYSGGIVIYRVNSSSLYEIEETPYCGDGNCDSSEGEHCGNCVYDCGYCPVKNQTPPQPVNPPSGGGGGGSGAVTGGLSPIINKAIFSVDKDVFQLTLKQGESIRDFMEIKNEGGGDVNFRFSSVNMERFVNFLDDNFTIIPQETKKVYILFKASENEIPDSYFGTILVSGNSIIKTIPVIIEVKKRESLFDIKTKVAKKNVRKDENKIKAYIDIYNMGDIKPVDVVLYYSVKNSEGRILTFRQETLAIKDKLSVTKELEIPPSNSGDYVFYSGISYLNDSASSMDHFKIYDKEEMPFTSRIIGYLNYQAIIIIIVIIITLIIIFLIYKRLTRVKYID